MSTGQQRRSTSTGSTQPALASSTRAMACSTPSVVSQRNVVLAPAPVAARFAPCAAGTSSRCPAPPPAGPGRGRRRRCPAPAWRCTRCRRRCRGESAPRRAGALPARRRCGGRTRRCRRAACARRRPRSWTGTGRRTGSCCPPRPAPRRGRAQRGLGGGRRGAAGASAGFGGSTTRPVRLGRALEPGEDGLGVAHGRGQPDALDVMPGDARQALDHAHQVGAAVGSRPARGPRR